MIRESIKKNGIRPLVLQAEFLEHDPSGARSTIYGLNNYDMAFLINLEVSTLQKRLIRNN